MKRNLVLTIICIFMAMLLLAGQSLAACPEDTVDSGECDTLYVEVLPGDEILEGAYENLVRFPIYVTHDLPDPVDSIGDFVIPLCFTSSNPAANAHLPDTCNTIVLFPWPNLHRSAFRHLDCGGEVITNWMMALSERLDGSEWDTRIINLVGEGEQTQVFWMGLFPTGCEDQRFWEGSRVLLATMTFDLDDTTTICIDSCFWPPNSRLSFTRMDAASYVPRHLLPVCQGIWIAGPPPYFQDGVLDQMHSENGQYSTDHFIVVDENGYITSISAHFYGEGVENVWVGIYKNEKGDWVEGWVEYVVTDHCLAGGQVVITATNNYEQTATDVFYVTLSNDAPLITLQDSWLALAGYTMVLRVPTAVDVNGDSVSAVELDAFWFEPDSLQPPTNPPTYNPGDPGSFTWVPEQADTGTWICSFSATDACGAVYTRQVSIEVGMPFCGDGTGDGMINVGDVVYLIGYLFKAGPAPDPPCKGDVTCDGSVDAGDLVYLINYFFRFGPAPCFECCP